MPQANQSFSLSRGNETFILIHGAWHGGWCWEKVEPLLHALGHKTLAPDLPAHGNNPGSISEQSLDTYVDYVVSILDWQQEPVILVGHSMGGVIISLAAEKRPEKVKKLVYVAAFLLNAGQSGHGIDGTGVKPKDLLSVSSDEKTVGCGEEMLKTRYAQCCNISDQSYIYGKLTDAEILEPLITPIYPTVEKWGSIRRFYIAGSEDVAMDPKTVEKMLTTLPCEDTYELLGDHDLFYSAPEELAFVLNQIAIKE